ncbi:unnamed protein product [Lymnaea stagnalis]|uniref:Uncharacterized protein n=1 Tax=Lymnaea stagnalis TaxID=6523 RepID=A0AAV2IE57_LYMST
MTAVEKEIGDQMKDYYMVELSARAVIRGKTDATPEEKMITRIPSFRIGPHTAPRIIPSNLVKEKEDVDEVKNVGLLSHEEARDIVVKTLLDKKRGSSKHVGADKGTPDMPWMHK